MKTALPKCQPIYQPTSKGSVLHSYNVQTVAPLHDVDVLDSSWEQELFEFPSDPSKQAFHGEMPTNFWQRIQEIANISTFEGKCAIFTAIMALKSSRGTTTRSEVRSNDPSLRESVERIRTIRQTAKYMQEEFLVDPKIFMELACQTFQSIHVVQRTHPLSEYVNQVLPRLPVIHQQAVMKKLGDVSGSVVSLIKQIQDKHPPLSYAVTICDAKETLPAHSCVPNAVLELSKASVPMTSKQTRLEVIALVDIQTNDPIEISYIPDMEGVEERDELLQLRLGSSCLCPRCRYEWDPENTIKTLNKHDMVRLASYYMTRARLEEADRLYRCCLDLDPSDASIRHAIGAIELNRGHFLQAQQYWLDAYEQYPETCTNHSGIRLQVEKGRAYDYFTACKETSSETGSLNIPSYTTLTSNVYISKVIDQNKCQEIIDLAHKSRAWTTGRHYAVPTTDIPIHQCKPLLEWFTPFFFEKIRPLLAAQFDSSSNFWVHDAFLVRYEAGQANSLLSVHTDESSHSFVLALNSDYSGGGTRFYSSAKTVRLEAGQILSFRGDLIEHGGEAVTAGERYIIAVFLYHDDGWKPATTCSENEERIMCSKRTREDSAMGFSGVMRQAKSQSTGTGDFSFQFSFGLAP